ncbi:hypothetical protein ACLIYP_00290 [Streptomyces nanhaiensis]|uniref:hypothetical protein n=1 Tax=Streptomyces nanhaiensis TaxID=679319 RepID=UPI00399D09F1
MEPRRFVAWTVRLLLLSAVLGGIVTMHSFGHPTQRTPSHGSVSSTEPVLDVSAGHAAHAAPNTSVDMPTADDPAPGAGLDPTSMCLAVLAVCAVALLTAAGLSRGAADRLGAVRARLLRVLWPVPPPGGRIPLARLSVLRI